jgi:hypothetical protein
MPLTSSAGARTHLAARLTSHFDIATTRRHLHLQDDAERLAAIDPVFGEDKGARRDGCELGVPSNRVWLVGRLEPPDLIGGQFHFD